MRLGRASVRFPRWRPRLCLKDGKLFLVLGSPGGPRIITTVANILMGVVDYGMNIQEAVNAPRFHHQWLPDVSCVEEGISCRDCRQLEGMGHQVEAEDIWSDGECIMIDPKRGDRLGASDAAQRQSVDFSRWAGTVRRS